MGSKNVSAGIPLSGTVIIGLLHEFIISEKREFLPIILFGLLATRGTLNSLKKISPTSQSTSVIAKGFVRQEMK